jgi:cell division protein DivIC
MKENSQIKNEVASLVGVPSQWLNKFTVVSLIFLIWILFLDKYNVFASSKINGIITKMESEKKSYEHKIAQAILDKQDLEKNHEKYAREKHFMHKPGEQIIIIEKQKAE